MGFEFNLIYLFFFYPLLYMGLIYLTMPIGSIKIKDMFKAVAMGYVSVTFLHFMYLIFPPEGEILQTAFSRYFYIVAPREEIAKFLSFLILVKYAIRKIKQPVTYMVLCGLVGLGFGIEENIIYYQRYGDEVLLIRNFCALLAHVFFGMFAGYFYGLGKLHDGYKDIKSNIGKYLNKLPKLKLAFYGFFGVFTGVLYHGLWNYNLHRSGFASEAIMILMLICGGLGVYAMGKDLIKGHIERISSKRGESSILKQQWLEGDGPQTD